MDKEKARIRYRKYVKTHRKEIEKYRIRYYKENWYYLNKYQKFDMGIKEARKMPHECEKCNDERLYVLQWHHKDLNRNNNKRSNVQVLCANCHMEAHYKKNKLGGMKYGKYK